MTTCAQRAALACSKSEDGLPNSCNAPPHADHQPRNRQRTVERPIVVADPDGKLSAVMLWAAWAEWNGTEPNQDEQIGGIAFGDVHEYFRDCFNAGDTVRRRLDGRAQRVWLGYRLADDESVLESED